MLSLLQYAPQVLFEVGGIIEAVDHHHRGQNIASGSCARQGFRLAGRVLAGSTGDFWNGLSDLAIPQASGIVVPDF